MAELSTARLYALRAGYRPRRSRRGAVGRRPVLDTVKRSPTISSMDLRAGLAEGTPASRFERALTQPSSAATTSGGKRVQLLART
jgi:hypothetical protein